MSVIDFLKFKEKKQTQVEKEVEKEVPATFSPEFSANSGFKWIGFDPGHRECVIDQSKLPDPFPPDPPPLAA